MDLEGLSDEQFCYLTTTGRVSGKPHRIEVWFALDGSTLYMLAGGGERSDWVRNLTRRPEVEVTIRDRVFRAAARLIVGEREKDKARDLLVQKYQPGYSGDLSSWRERALPVAVDL